MKRDLGVKRDLEVVALVQARLVAVDQELVLTLQSRFGKDLPAAEALICVASEHVGRAIKLLEMAGGRRLAVAALEQRLTLLRGSDSYTRE